MNSAWRNVALLSACQAMLLSTNSTLIAINGLAGLELAPYRSLATLPVTFYVLGAALTTMPASLYMRRVGRRPGLMQSTAFAVAGALVCATAIRLQSFWLLCAGALLFGGFNAFGQYYRFAAVDVAQPELRASAISLVLAGGLAGGIIGPTTSRATIDLLGPKFLGAYLALIVFALVTLALLAFIRIPKALEHTRAPSGRPLREIVAQPKYIVAAMGAAIGYGVMNFLMTSTPIAMGVCGHPYKAAAFVISSHVVGMYLPSFFAGRIIRRLGVLRVMLAGAALNLGSIAIALSGIAVPYFWSSLVLLGVGWNFLYIGGTTLLTETYRPEEMAKAQGANDFIIFAMQVLSSFSSGVVVTNAGWKQVNLSALSPVILVIVAIVWLGLRERAARAAAA
ncbi:MAG: MFS transporter [Betaproteobacteria bacterium]|nr:MFS transporter [Betaproteobacteria bacterium]